MRVLFLDLDGTMRQRSEARARSSGFEDRLPMLEPEAVTALNHILQRTGARIVISSDWAVAGRNKLQELLTTNGIAGILHDDWRTTPLSTSARSSEINWWLDAHPEIRA
jgi:hypothetical protein